MSILKLKNSLISQLKEDKHCILALEKLLNEIPYDQMRYIGRISFHNLLNRALKTRKKYKSYINLHQKSLQKVRIQKPIFITGLPRSGTTLLQNLLIHNFQIEGIRFWELLNPIPISNNIQIDNIIRKINAWFLITLVKKLGPNINSMHPINIFSFEECWHLFLMTFNVYNFDFQLCISNYGKWISNHSINKAYVEYSEILKIILNQRNTNQIILKCPEHMMFTDSINKIFPDNKIIWIHRDPVKSITSYTNMIYEINKFYRKSVEKIDVSIFVMKRFQKMIKKIIYSRDELGVKIIDVQYTDLISDNKNVLEFLNKECEIDKTKNIPQKKQPNIDKFKSQIINEPEKLGIDPNKIYYEFYDYMERFQINKEIKKLY